MQPFSWLRGGYFFRGVSVMAKIRSLRLQLTIVIVAITVVLTLIMGMMNIRSINIYSTEVAKLADQKNRRQPEPYADQDPGCG